LLANLALNIVLIGFLSRTTEIKTEDDLIPPGAKPGTIPTDYLQATGLERLELIGKMQGIDIFDMRPLDASRKGMCTIFLLFVLNPHVNSSPIIGTCLYTAFEGENALTKALPETGTLENPIIVTGAGDEQYAGCTGYPVDSHQVNWLTVRSPQVPLKYIKTNHHACRSPASAPSNAATSAATSSS
jgi:cytochrome c oxidase subunit 5b